MNTLETKDVNNQHVLLEMVKMFDKVCQENDIEYFLAGGNCLGAVRHEGFLPWDDDIDMYMKASEWEAKRDIIRDALPERYELVCNEYNEYYYNQVIRITDKETTQIFRSRISDRSEHGIQIEIFLLDSIPNNKEARQEYYENFWLYSELFQTTMQVSSSNMDITDAMFERYYQLEKRAESGEREVILAELREKLFSYDENECTDYHLRWGQLWITFPKSAFRSARRVKFEDAMLPIPEGFTDVLFGEYGDDWMMIPDMEETWNHDMVQNLDVPYQVYENKYKGQIDIEAYHHVQEANKQYKMVRSANEINMRAYFAKHLEAIALSYVDKDNKEEIYKKYQYEAFQFHHMIHAPEGLIANVMYESFINGDLKFIRKMNEVYDGDNEDIKKILSDVWKLRDIRASYYLGNGKNYLKSAIAMIKEYPRQINLLEFICQVSIDNRRDIDETKKLLDIAINQYGDRPRLMKTSADISRIQGDWLRAKDMYEKILESSRNGIVNLEIKKILQEEF